MPYGSNRRRRHGKSHRALAPWALGGVIALAALILVARTIGVLENRPTGGSESEAIAGRSVSEIAEPTPAPVLQRIPDLEVYRALLDARAFDGGVGIIEENWFDGSIPMLLETMRLVHVRPAHYDRLGKLVADRAGLDWTGNVDPLWQWLWKQDYEPHPDYYAFKQQIYGPIDPHFEAYFKPERAGSAKIRADEIRWGGVRRDGIPPLHNPKMLAMEEAAYLAPSNVVFGIEINGDARAYPKRILAWHEMFTDVVGGVPIAGVYCTLCGSMIVYETLHEGVQHELGTSGFLYRSNKLMYDKATESLWSTLQGEPVVGPLAGKGIRLKVRPVTTSSWWQWKAAHPDTTVLSLDTGYLRDYGEGVAYRDYFATDDLMFTVPSLDTRLDNKDEVLVLRFGEEDPPTAIAVEFLADRTVYRDVEDGIAYTILTDSSGANRIYRTGDVEIAAYDGARTAEDAQGRRWEVREDALRSEGAEDLPRLPAHRAFWFGVHAAFPEARLVGARESTEPN